MFDRIVYVLLDLYFTGATLMSIELEMLVWVATMTLCLWIPYILPSTLIGGVMAALKRQGDEATPYPWTGRAKRAHNNAIENLIPFTAIVLVAHMAEISNETTQLAAIAYFWFRAVHYVFYTLGIPIMRTLSFFGGWLAQLCIAYQILSL